MESRNGKGFRKGERNRKAKAVQQPSQPSSRPSCSHPQPRGQPSTAPPHLRLHPTAAGPARGPARSPTRAHAQKAKPAQRRSPHRTAPSPASRRINIIFSRNLCSLSWTRHGRRHVLPPSKGQGAAFLPPLHPTRSRTPATAAMQRCRATLARERLHWRNGMSTRLPWPCPTVARPRSGRFRPVEVGSPPQQTSPRRGMC